MSRISVENIQNLRIEKVACVPAANDVAHGQSVLLRQVDAPTIPTGARKAVACSRSACIGPTQEKTGHELPNVIADAALAQRLQQGARECDGQEHANRGNAPLMGTWSGWHRSGPRMEKADLPRSPCRSYGAHV